MNASLDVNLTVILSLPKVWTHEFCIDILCHGVEDVASAQDHYGWIEKSQNHDVYRGFVQPGLLFSCRWYFDAVFRLG